jgi:hypothetical protein
MMDVEDVLGLTKDTDLDAEHLDEIVHQVASEIGSNANNEGMEAQIRFLCEHMEVEEVHKYVKKLLEELYPPEDFPGKGTDDETSVRHDAGGSS